MISKSESFLSFSIGFSCFVVTVLVACIGMWSILVLVKYKLEVMDIIIVTSILFGVMAFFCAFVFVFSLLFRDKNECDTDYEPQDFNKK